MIQKLKKNKKGFTLVELLVVLVILAILAAAIIPSMMGFIDKAKEESHAAECRSVLLAAEVRLNELYGSGAIKSSTTTPYEFTTTATTGDIAQVQKISALEGTIKGITATKGKDDHWTISAAKYAPKGETKYHYDYNVDDNTWVKVNTALA